MKKNNVEAQKDVLKLNLLIKDITISEAKRIVRAVREIDNETPDRFIFIQILGLEDKSVKKAGKILREIFLSKKTAG